jgi:hypothetical protein
MRTWGLAHQMWKAHGERTGLYLEPEVLKSLEEEAGLFRAKFKLTPYDRSPPIPEDMHSPALDRGQIAQDRLYWLGHYQRTTNFLHFYYSTQIEQDPKCIELRKSFYQANQFREAGEREAALEIYRTTLPKWRELLLAHKEFRMDDDVQETTFEMEFNYLDLVQTLYGNRNKQLAVLTDLMAQLAQRPLLGTIWLPPAVAARDLAVSISSPMGKDADGQDIIPDHIIDRVLERKHLPPRRAPVAPPPGEPGGPPQGAPGAPTVTPSTSRPG